jgi:hypothetical protein
VVSLLGVELVVGAVAGATAVEAVEADIDTGWVVLGG